MVPILDKFQNWKKLQQNVWVQTTDVKPNIWHINGFSRVFLTHEPRKPEEVFDLDELLHKLKNTEIHDEDIPQITKILQDRNIIVEEKKVEESEKLFIFLLRFWDFEESPYIREKTVSRQNITKNHCKDMTNQVVNHWKPFFKNKKLNTLTRQDLKDFSLHLAVKKKTLQNGELSLSTLKASTVNRILSAGLTGLRWGYNNDLLHEDITKGLKKFSVESQKRGILSDAEVNKLFTDGKWPSPAVRLGNLLACQTGLRLGEVSGLRVEDIGEDRLFINHSWSEVDHLKGTKTNEKRSVPVRSDLRKNLIDYAKMNPFGYGPKSFVFWCVDNPARPYRGDNISKGLNSALASIGIKKAEKKARNLSFHGWRHYFARTMADALGARTAKLTGHLTPEMLEHYANHANEKDFQKALKATDQIFGRILPFQEQMAK